MADHNPNQPSTREREVIVTDGGRRGPGIGGVIAAVVGAVVVLLLAWMLFFQGGGGDVEEPSDVDIEAPVPDDVDVNEGGDAG